MIDSATQKFDVCISAEASSAFVKVSAIDTTLNPLQVLKTVVESLSLDPDIGLWLEPFSGISMVPRVSPFDLVYLDDRQTVMSVVAVLPGVHLPRSKEKVASALVLPFHTSSRIGLKAGVLLHFRADEETTGHAGEPFKAGTAHTPPESTSVAIETSPAEMNGLVSTEPTEAEQNSSQRPPLTEPELEVVETPEDSLPGPSVAQLAQEQDGPAESVAPASTIPPTIPQVQPKAAHQRLKSKAKRRQLKRRKWKELPFGEIQSAQTEQQEEVSRTEAEDDGVETTAETLDSDSHPEPSILKIMEVEPVLADLPAPTSDDPETPDIEPETEPPAVSTELIPAQRETTLGMEQMRHPLGAESESAALASGLENPIRVPFRPVVDPVASVESHATTSPPAPPAPKHKHWPAAPPQEVKKPAPAPPVPPVEKQPLPIQPFNVSRTVSRTAAPLRNDLGKRFTGLMHWLYPHAFEVSNRRESRRRPIPGLVAYPWERTSLAYEIGNLSGSGLYLLTNERWPCGAVVPLSLQQAGEREERPNHRITVEAGTVRWGARGLGLTFVRPNVNDIRLWEGLPDSPWMSVGPDTVVQELRTARALTFLRRMCPSAIEEFRALLHKEFTAHRALSAVEIALMAEDIIVRNPGTFGLLAHRKLVRNVLDVGSWAEFESVQVLWAGLLATGCTAEGSEAINLTFSEKLAQFTELHADLFIGVCARAAVALRMRGELEPFEAYCTTKDLIEITRTRNLNRIRNAVVRLCDLGLLETRIGPSYLVETDGIQTSATSLGLKLFARCYRTSLR